MRNSAIVQWLNNLRTSSTPKPRRAMLGLNAFESRDMPSAALAASAVVDVAHARTCGDGNHGSKVSAVAKTIGDKVKDCKPPVSTPCDNGSHGKGSNNKGSGGKCDNGSKGKGSNGKSSGGKRDNGSNGKGSNNKGSSGKGSNCKVVVPPACEVPPPPSKVPPPPSCEVPPPPCPVPPPPCDDTPKQKGNNGVGNGLDPQPPGNPRINDGPGTSPGRPGNKGGK